MSTRASHSTDIASVAAIWAVVDSGDLPSGVAEGARLDRRPDHRLGAFVLAAINEFVDSLPLAVALENLLLAVAVGIFVWLR